MNNRSMGLDSECDVVIDTGCTGNEGTRDVIEAIRDDLLAEHLGAEAHEVRRRLAETGSLIATVESLRGNGRSLKTFVPPEFSRTSEKIAESETLDPERPEGLFEPLSSRKLLRHLPRPA